MLIGLFKLSCLWYGYFSRRHDGFQHSLSCKNHTRKHRRHKCFVGYSCKSRFKRDGGLSGHSHGYIVGSDWKIGKKSFGGLHAAYALGSADVNIYSAYSNLKSFLYGLHYTLYPEENKNWIRMQATFFNNRGDTNFTMPAATNILTGKSSNKSNDFYLAVNAGMSNQLSVKNELRSEIGLSYLKMTDAPKIHWGVLGESVSGYDMKFDKYNALY